MWRALRSLAGSIVCAAAIPAGAVKTPDLQQVESLVVERTNAFRAEQGLAPLRRNRELDASARAYAALMTRLGTLSHEADGTTAGQRAAASGYEHCVIAENIARQYSSLGFATGELGRGLVEGWKGSPGHRKNMVDGDVTETGVAIAHRSWKGIPDYFAVQLFGRPASAQFEFEIRNATAALVRYRVGERAYTLPPRYSRIHTECAPRPLAFEAGDAPRYSVTGGERFVVTSSRGQVTVRRE